jgi:hypothetical protein
VGLASGGDSGLSGSPPTAMESSFMASNATRVPVMRNRLWLLESVFAVWMDTSQSRQSRARSSEQKKNALFSCNSAFFLLRNPQNGALQTLMLQVTKPHPQPFQCKIPNMSFQSFSYNHSSQYHSSHIHRFTHPLWCTTSMLRLTNARSPFKYESPEMSCKSLF